MVEPIVLEAFEGVKGVLIGVVDDVAVGDAVVGAILLVVLVSAVAGDVMIAGTMVLWEETVPVEITKNYYTDKEILRKDDYFKMTKNIQATLEDINSLA